MNMWSTSRLIQQPQPALLLGHYTALLSWFISWRSIYLTLCAVVCSSWNMLCCFYVFCFLFFLSPAVCVSAWLWLSSLQSKFYLIVSFPWKFSWLLQVPGFIQVMCFSIKLLTNFNFMYNYFIFHYLDLCKMHISNYSVTDMCKSIIDSRWR